MSGVGGQLGGDNPPGTEFSNQPMVSSLARGNRLDLPFNQHSCHFLSLLHCMLGPVSQVRGEIGQLASTGWLVSGTVRDSILP
jgi:hypothetical protein